MATERKSPDAILELSNLSPNNVAYIQDDPDSPDSNWLLFVTNNVDTVCRVSFPTPTGNPTQGADLQQFKIWVKCGTGTGTPTVTIKLYENGVLLASGAAENVNNSAGELHSWTWDATLLGTADGSLVECYILGSAVGGGPSTRDTVSVGAVEWNVTYSTGQTFYQSIPATSIGSGVLNRASTFYRTLASTAIGTAVLATAKMFAKVLNAVAIGVSNLTIVKTFIKSITATAIGSATLSRIKTCYRLLTSVVTASPLLSKKLYQTLTATSIGSVVLSKAKFFSKSISAIATGVVSLSTVKILGKALSATASVVAGLTKVSTYYRTLTSTSTGVSSLTKGLYKSLASTAIGSAILSKVTTLKKALTSVVTGVANLGTQFIAGGGGQTFYKTLTLVGQAIVSLLITPQRILSIKTDVTTNQDLNLTTKISTLYSIISQIKCNLKIKSILTEK